MIGGHSGCEQMFLRDRELVALKREVQELTRRPTCRPRSPNSTLGSTGSRPGSARRPYGPW
jgi:hypothetical protein